MVPVSLRRNQAIPLTYAQVDDNFENLANAAELLGGDTASRPTSPRLYSTYFDTTLGYPIYCKQLGPVIWVNATGTTV